jgi:small subunit ribosomal protein S7
MPRRRVVAKREVLPDPKFGNTTLAKFMNHVMVSGKKSVAEAIVYGALDLVEERTKRDPIEVFEEALENIAPMVEVKSRRVGGATYQVPVEVRPARRVALSMRWLVDYARNRSEKSMRSVWPVRSSMRRRARAMRLRSVKTCIAWLKPTRRSRTSASDFGSQAFRTRAALWRVRLPSSRYRNIGIMRSRGRG